MSEVPFYGHRLRMARELAGGGITDSPERRRLRDGAELSRVLGISEQTLVRIETDQTKPSRFLVERAALVLGWPIGWFSRPPVIDLPMGSLLIHGGKHRGSEWDDDCDPPTEKGSTT